MINMSFLKEKGNKYLVFIIIGLLVLVLAIPNGDIGVGETKITSQTVGQSELESQLERVLSVMEGVGEVDVMITVESTGSSLFGESSNTQKVCGVVIVAEGAGNSIVEARISNAVKALFSIDAHKISIVKRAMQEEDR